MISACSAPHPPNRSDTQSDHRVASAEYEAIAFGHRDFIFLPVVGYGEFGDLKKGEGYGHHPAQSKDAFFVHGILLLKKN
jgi:hypothetical protein